MQIQPLPQLQVDELVTVATTRSLQSLGNSERMLNGHYSVAISQRQSSRPHHLDDVVIQILLGLLAAAASYEIRYELGTWLRPWREHRAKNIRGSDGDYIDPTRRPTRRMIPSGSFRHHDLLQRLGIERAFDWAKSLETAEYLPQDRVRGVAVCLTCITEIAAFAATVPRETGANHLNARRQDYWAELINQRGCFKFDVLRHRFRPDERAGYCYQYHIDILSSKRDFSAARAGRGGDVSKISYSRGPSTATYGHMAIISDPQRCSFARTDRTAKGKFRA